MRGDSDERTFYCTVDTHLAVKDYLRGGRCVRFIGVKPHEFHEQTFLDGVTSFTVDVDYWVFCQRVLGLRSWRAVSSGCQARLRALDDDPNTVAKWYRITIETIEVLAPNYFYPTFSEQAPTFFKLANIEPLNAGPDVPKAPQRMGEQLIGRPSPNAYGAKRKPFVFDTFHVGQGMCSLVHDGTYGLLLDAGAGKPVLRGPYLAGQMTNDLGQLASRLSYLDLVLSHSDSDHWRLLAWDSGLRSKIQSILVPVGARTIAFLDRAVKSKIAAIVDTHITLDSTSTLRLLRSSPSHSDSNGECLVAVFQRRRKRVLAAGDYVYERFLTDGNPHVSGLHSVRYAGVVVPHHGDRASANCLVPPRKGSKAFFSAGTHQGYKHPTQVSLDAHRARRYSVIANKYEPNIRLVNLI